MQNDRRLQLFALDGDGGFGQRVSDQFGLPLSEHEERRFEDGEHKARPLVSVRGADVFVISSLYSEPRASVNDKLVRLLFFLGAVRDAGAARVNAVVPYLCYARKDVRTQPHDPITTRYVAAMFEAAGVANVMTLDVHNQVAFDNAFRCATQPLTAIPLFVEHFAPLLAMGELAVVSPDAGGIKRAERFRQALQHAADEQGTAGTPGRTITSSFMEKYRSGGVVRGETFVGDVRGRSAILYDDLIATGTTLVRAAHACRDAGAEHVYAAATHGLFMQGAPELLTNRALETIVVTDTVPPFRVDPEHVAARLAIVEAAPLIADAIRRVHADEAVTASLW